MSRWVLGAPKSAALVPPRENLGGSYPMLNSTDVRYVIPSVCPPNWDMVHPWGGRAFLQPLSRWFYFASQDAKRLVPPKFTSGGYYLLLNPIVAC